jgi:hypothetical protein
MAEKRREYDRNKKGKKKELEENNMNGERMK